MNIVRILLKLAKIVYHTIYRDLLGAILLVSIRVKMMIARWKNETIGEKLDKQAIKYGSRTVYIYNNQKWTFKMFNDYTNQVANYFYRQGFRKGDEIALIMESRVEYSAIWIGLSKIGVITALINPNLQGYSLAHSINVINTKAIIFSDHFEKVIVKAKPLLNNGPEMRFYAFGRKVDNQLISLDLITSLASMETELTPETLDQKPNYNDPIFYCYTSGTTGLPKAAIIKQSRIYYTDYGWIYAGKITSNDIFYCPLPLYHMIGVISITAAIFTGCTTVIRHKFSAKNYWKEFYGHNCSVAVFIGELCRFLLAQPSSPLDGHKPVRLVISTGLRPSIWEDFVRRFSIKRVVEFYGSTEGNSSIINLTGKVGAIGFLPVIYPKWLLNFFYPIKIIKVNVETGEPVRDEKGFCSDVKAGDTGMIIANIMKGDSLMEFDGYVDCEATNKKIIRNVHRIGDSFFSSGDLVTIDKYYYVYFKDRIGDTYRWRGENVSTNEVESIMARFLQLTDVAVFGVEIAGEEGRIGMAAIVEAESESNIDLVALIAFLRKSLPAYAIPHFIRIIKQIAFTGTMKISKHDLKKDAYNMDKVKDPLYYLDNQSGFYKPLTRTIYEDIMNAHYRV